LCFVPQFKPTNIKQLAKYDFSEQDPTNHAVLVLVQALFRTDICCIEFFFGGGMMIMLNLLFFKKDESRFLKKMNHFL